jgi:FKBP-type peptidyl-prolyl cis-trans isomerase 2
MKFFKVMLFCGLILMTLISYSKGEEIMIQDGSKVKMDYTLKVEDQVVDTSEGRGPLEYVQGDQMIIPGLERELAGLKVGDKKDVVVQPEDGYGPIRPEAMAEVDKAQLPPDSEPQVGMMLSMMTQDNQQLTGVIDEIREETVVINFNHPLAGKELHFSVEIVGIE